MDDVVSPTLGEFERARGIVVDALELVSEAYPMDTEPAVELGWGGEAWIVEAVDGASGFASHPNRIELEFNTAADGWCTSLRSTTVHEYGHVWCSDVHGRPAETQWEYVLEEAFTQHLAAQLVPEYESPWWTTHDTAAIAEHWPEARAELDDPSDDGGAMYTDSTDGGYPLGYGYSLAYQVGELLLEEHDLTDLPTLGKPALLDAAASLYEETDGATGAE